MSMLQDGYHHPSCFLLLPSSCLDVTNILRMVPSITEVEKKYIVVILCLCKASFVLPSCPCLVLQKGYSQGRGDLCVILWILMYGLCAQRVEWLINVTK